MNPTVGDVATLDYTLTVAGVLTNADVQLTLTAPDGTITTPGFTHPTTGKWTADVLVDQAGVWLYRWVASGAATDVEDGSFVVDPLNSRPAWLPTPDEVHSQIPTRPAFTDTSVPSVGDVSNVIRLVADSLAAEFPALPATAYPVAKAYVTYSAAAILEAKYDPEQQFGGDTAQMTMLDQRAGVELQRLRNLYASGSGLVAPGARAFTIGGLPDTYRPGVVTPLGYFPAY
jgi:hypothetical protein